MKLFLIFLTTISLYATCPKEKELLAQELFLKAIQSKDIKKQHQLLRDSLKNCFTYEVKYSLIMLKIEQTNDIPKKIRLYNQALKTLSHIKGKDTLVKQAQSDINKKLATYYKNNPHLAQIYQQKAQTIESKLKEQNFKYFIFIVIFILVVVLLRKIFYKKSK